jgi:hypothetical protein
MDQRLRLILLAIWVALGWMAGVAAGEPRLGLASGATLGVILYFCFMGGAGSRRRGPGVRRASSAESRAEAVKWFIFLRSVEAFIVSFTIFLMVEFVSWALGMDLKHAALALLQS